MLGLIVILLAGHGLLAAHAKSIDGVDVKSLCRNELDALLTARQVSALAQQAKDEAECPEVVKEALAELGALTASDNICAQSTADQLVQFYIKFLAVNKLPAPLRSFALSLLMRASHACQANMVSELAGDANKQLEKDLEAVSEWTGAKGKMDELLQHVNEHAVVVLPSDAIAIINNDFSRHNGKTHVDQVPAKIVELKAMCDKRFKPVYQQLAGPVATLERAGFSGHMLEQHKLEPASGHTQAINTWTRVVFLCEALDLVDIDAAGAKHIEQLEFASRAKVTMKELEHLPTAKLDELERHLESFHVTFERYADEVQRTIWQAVRSHLRPQDAKEIGQCSGLDDVEAAAEPEEKKLCGSRFTYPAMAVGIALAAMAAAMLA